MEPSARGSEDLAGHEEIDIQARLRQYLFEKSQCKGAYVGNIITIIFSETPSGIANLWESFFVKIINTISVDMH